ncbi:MAG: extracellular solute-binding protein [Propionibacteriaceae bacterium]|nr:extracellular solute-binding protein [Propionibacteriaceae bacterium]
MRFRWLAVLPALALMAAGVTACGSNSTSQGGPSGSAGSQIGGKLVVYTPNEQNMLDALMPAFKKATGIDYQLVTATTGELYTRIQSEASNPQGDILFGGGVAQAMANSKLWEPYVGANDAQMEPIGKNVGGYSTPYQADGSCLLVNTDKVGDISITGYADLLNPKLKGQIAFGDPTNSSSAFAQLTNMLAAMGGASTVDADYTSQAGWDYVTNILKQTGGKSIGSSSEVAQDVAQGEYIVALTYEAQAMNQVQAGLPVKVVYPKEGAVYLPSGVQIIKGAKDMTQAKAFADWIQSQQAQQIIADATNGRPLRADISLQQGMTPLSQIKQLTEDSDYVSAHRNDIVAQYSKILASIS